MEWRPLRLVIQCARRRVMKSTHHLVHSNTCRIQIGEYQWFEDFDFAWSVIVFETTRLSLRIDISDAQNDFLFFEFTTINFELVWKVCEKLTRTKDIRLVWNLLALVGTNASAFRRLCARLTLTPLTPRRPLTSFSRDWTGTVSPPVWITIYIWHRSTPAARSMTSDISIAQHYWCWHGQIDALLFSTQQDTWLCIWLESRL